MIKLTRVHYMVLMCATIVLGLLSRKITGIPLSVGDGLYAVMVYWLCRFIFFQRSHSFCFVSSLLFCFAIEFLQLVQHPLLISVRSHPLLRLLFGQGFLWSDLIAYIAGSAIAFLLDRTFHRSKTR
ncbi:uncharacterized protein DUF2809 [Sphingobacterium detergens]|uniref:Uncharacterized protein DUF2809 n=2 Tax=Sphingobacterium detergens TaxID=1145106 RepID=A0A420BHL6_SPHD1|nr:uncharacterized protein DUF2809 [Sphingobacterium detergens]